MATLQPSPIAWAVGFIQATTTATGVTGLALVEGAEAMVADDRATIGQIESRPLEGQLVWQAPSALEVGEKVLFRLAVFATFNLIDDAAMLAFMFC